MNILVIGGHFFNKGAHLMLKSVIDELGKHPQYKLYLSPCAGTKEQIRELGYNTIDYPLKHVSDFRGFNLFFRFGSVLKYLRKQYRGELKMNNIHAVLDISGFAYSDQWGVKTIKNANVLIQYFKKNKAKFIFLPQAFGPFSGKVIQENMVKAIESSDLVVARDKNSLDMLLSLTNNEKIKLFPDITINISSSNKEKFLYSNYTCIVPNERMLDQGREYWPEGMYLNYVYKSIDLLLAETDHKIILLIHDKGKGDTDLANSIKQKYEDIERVVVYYEEDTLLLKSIIGGANMIIGSRYHALVSALSQNVPSLGLGWSHKYNMLFDEYSISDFSFEKPNNELYEIKMKNLLNKEFKNNLVERISKSNKILKEKNKQMWTEVKGILDS
ncbi:hypothetical protein F8C76_12455 [Flagellimonas olearia]|uniref:Polysaccharide pyruvyl transferase domain-containing protein n=1 Tax=Flagellimonas olearia TaxID=552546 RepID=A0A6I1E4Z5_9FLAO|nr:polysaccharide pyruvyl transferase family protein [Allomuricauda olearia]KAB7528666.1 hypothetical protein F8C76_12455 [Allomuricauda olearia]